MMNDMIVFCTLILQALTHFLVSSPIFELFSLICFCFIVKAFKILVTPKNNIFRKEF